MGRVVKLWSEINTENYTLKDISSLNSLYAKRLFSYIAAASVSTHFYPGVL